MNCGSIGEIPPRTHKTSGLAWRTASAARSAISAKILQSGSTSKSQWDLLFGSFQIITASIITRSRSPFPHRLGQRIAAGQLHSFIVVSSNRGIDRTRLLRQRDVLARENLGFRMVDDLESGAAQHCFHTSPIWNPPVRRIASVPLLHKIHLRKSRSFENFGLPEVVIILQRIDLFAPALHRLKQEKITRDVLVKEVEREQRM